MKHIRKDEIGKRYGRLVVLCFSHVDEKYKLAYWKCKCDCGNIVIIAGSSLRKGNTNSCGCYKKDRKCESTYIDITGERFGKLVAIFVVGKTKAGKTIWRCKCDCGKSIYISK